MTTPTPDPAPEMNHARVNDAVLWLMQGVSTPGFARVLAELLHTYCAEATFSLFGNHSLEIYFPDGHSSRLTLLEEHAVGA